MDRERARVFGGGGSVYGEEEGGESIVGNASVLGDQESSRLGGGSIVVSECFGRSRV